MDLDQMMTDVAVEYSKGMMARRAAADLAKEQERQRLTDEVCGRVRALFGDDLWAELAPEPILGFDKKPFLLIKRDFDAVSCAVTLTEVASIGRVEWRINGRVVKGNDHERAEDLVVSDKLKVATLLALALLRDKYVPAFLQRHADQAAGIEKAEAKQRARQDEHERIKRDIIQPAVARSMESLWRWKDGVSIALYSLIYCTAAGSDGDGAEYDAVWTTEAQLRPDGFIAIHTGVRFDRLEIKLDMMAHKPVWRRFMISNVDELQEMLYLATERVVIPIPGIDVVDGLYCAGDGVLDYVPQPAGYQPVAWVRELIDAASQQA